MEEAEQLTSRQQKPRLIFKALVDFLQTKKIQVPKERGRNNFPNSSKKRLCLRVSFEKQSLYPKFGNYFHKNIKKCEKS